MSSADVGTAALVVGFGAALYAVGAGIYAGQTGRREWAASARRAIYALLGLLLVAMAVLEAAYIRSDFSFELVAQNSSTDTPTFYKLTAMWSSQAGSLLLWAFLLSLFSSAVLFLTRHRLRDIAPYATAVLGGVAAFFLFLMLFYASPFATLATAPAEGAGLNPLLRHPAMMFHPPMLYTGYVGFTIPFAFAVGALIKRHTGPEWIRATRRFALVAWTFLGFGILLGSLWSYSELGWGGYWAWDPVENASLMPWLTGTAFIHSIMVQEKRGMLRIWNVSLIVATFMLALLGTFLVRSGILDSIHAFGASTLGKPFLVFIAFALLASVALVVSRRNDLRSDAQVDALLSREVFFLLNNLALILICVVIFWGTFFPLISEALTGTEESVGPPFFNGIIAPIALVLVALSALGPLLTWRRNTWKTLRRAFLFPLVAGARGIRRAAGLHVGRGQRGRDGDVHAGRVRGGRRGAGVPPRHPRPEDHDRRVAAARPVAARRAQPAPLRRLHRARWHCGAPPGSGRFLLVQRAEGRQARAGRDGEDQGLRGHLPRAHRCDRGRPLRHRARPCRSAPSST